MATEINKLESKKLWNAFYELEADYSRAEWELEGEAVYADYRAKIYWAKEKALEFDKKHGITTIRK